MLRERRAGRAPPLRRAERGLWARIRLISMDGAGCYNDDTVSLELPPIAVTVRSYQPADAASCKRLFSEGRMNGVVVENDTAVDLDDIQGAYFGSGGCFFVALNSDNVILGMIGVQQHEGGEAEIKRLRVRHDCRRRGIGTKLLEAALRYCKERQYLKVTLDTFIDREPALRLFEKFKFRHSRTRDVAGKTLLYFYLDLYSSEQPTKRVS